jgi:hypothetical protein
MATLSEVLEMGIGSQLDIKFSNVSTKEIVRVEENKWEIHDTVGGWNIARVNDDELINLFSGEISLMDLDWV